MYQIVWKYQIKEEFREDFVHEYGPKGMWVNFFSSSAYYRGSMLFASAVSEVEFLLIDTWLSLEEYNKFLLNSKVEYDKISKCFEMFYTLVFLPS